MVQERKIQINSKKPAMEPRTMPAIAPPERVCAESGWEASVSVVVITVTVGGLRGRLGFGVCGGR